MTRPPSPSEQLRAWRQCKGWVNPRKKADLLRERVRSAVGDYEKRRK